MTKLILRIYDFLLEHRRLCLLSFLLVTTLLFVLMLRLNFKEDISAFLPLDNKQQSALSVYQDVSGASKILAIFQYNDTTEINPDEAVSAIIDFEDHVYALDTANIVRNLVTEFDLERLTQISDFVYHNIPYFLTDDDYARMDSLLSLPDYISNQLDEDKQLLMFPSGGLLSANLQKDPLNLFSPVVSKLKRTGARNVEMYDGYIFTPDMSRAIVMMESPYGNSETQNNAKLMALLDQVADSVEANNDNISVHYIGGPAIAVGNAKQIKRDSLLSISIALVLIVALLVVVFRRLRNILLIVVSVAWGWLFAMAILSVIHDSVSLIVVGISSIILGIAVNYPLHLIAHTAHTQSMRQVLREIITPLIIGNITTVGAFMALIPLKAAALRDLGIFSAFILIGTILFVVVYLPHAVKAGHNATHHRVKPLEWVSNIKLENNKWIALAVVLLTCIFGYYSLSTRFDANMSHINYMTDQQHQDMEYFKQFTSGETDSLQCLYVVSEGDNIDQAMDNSLALGRQLNDIVSRYDGASLSTSHRFLPSISEQARRLARWDEFVSANRRQLCDRLGAEAKASGFSDGAFDEFYKIVLNEYTPEPFAYFDPLHNIYSSNISMDSVAGYYRIVDAVYLYPSQMDVVKAEVDALPGAHFCFDVPSMNSAMANSLSDNFNYIGWACGLIVFFFLWFSFSSIELAMLSFLPMAVSWIWIMGIMGLTDIQFNIVNIILATFIFGQGDDYTIFMTEGCCYEYAYRKRMLASYKSSIIISALIMFIGIGTLIFAKHPALHSLAEVTIVGMFSVVLMAYLLPPLIFGWITKSHGHYRTRPLTLASIMRTWACGVWWIMQLSVGYIIGFFLFVVFRRNAKTELMFHKFVSWCHKIDIKLMPGVKTNIYNPYNEQLSKPCVIVSNHQSLLDPMYFMAWSPKIIIVANERSSRNPVVRVMFKWLGFYTVRESNFTAWVDSAFERDLDKFRKYISQGYSIAVFPEGVRNTASTILRCHKGPFYLAQQLGVDVLPVLLHGVNSVFPKGNFASYSGTINMHICKRIGPCSQLWSDDLKVMTKGIHRYLVKEYDVLRKKYENSAYFKALVIDRYRYKGTEVIKDVKHNLQRTNNYSNIVDSPQSDKIYILNSGYGEMPLLMSLVHPSCRIIAFESDPDLREIARYAAEGLVKNVEYHDMPEFDRAVVGNNKIYDL